ncbi:MAG: hypothetical protein Ct9H300mP23_02540 [Nitrospinota bacterium]|nr:MAG: hypothetical protein Ct9H300mP23_02540 [Nitrospinota bacterium]
MFYHHNLKQSGSFFYWKLNEDISLFDGGFPSLEDNAGIQVFYGYKMEKQLSQMLLRCPCHDFLPRFRSTKKKRQWTN